LLPALANQSNLYMSRRNYTKETSFRHIPKHESSEKLIKLNVKDLKPTQMCIGLAQVENRKIDFKNQAKERIVKHLINKPVPVVTNGKNEYWMLDRHHRLRALLEVEHSAEAYGYVVKKIDNAETSEILSFLNDQGWLYLYDNKGLGPYSPKELPINLLEMKDDPYRSLAWRLKQEGIFQPKPDIPYYEFRWSLWLRTRNFPPFNSRNLEPALIAARKLVSSQLGE